MRARWAKHDTQRSAARDSHNCTHISCTHVLSTRAVTRGPRIAPRVNVDCTDERGTAPDSARLPWKHFGRPTAICVPR
eukprot:1680519-Prymnesium_polylepis.1